MVTDSMGALMKKMMMLAMTLACLMGSQRLLAVPLLTATPTSTATVTDTNTPTPSPTATETAVCGATFGCAVCTPGYGGGEYSPWLRGAKFNMPVSGTVRSLSVNLANGQVGNPKMRIGIYTNNANQVGTLIAQGNEDASLIAGWNDVNIIPTYLNSGDYWIVALFYSDLSNFTAIWEAQSSQTLSTDIVVYSNTYAYGTLPNNFVAGSVSYFTNSKYVFSASFCPGPPIFLTATPSPTPSATVSPTATESPIFASSGGLGKLVLAPVPAKQGQTICLYFDAAPKASHWQIYKLTGERVADLEFTNEVAQCWDTLHVAPGIYFVRTKVDYADGSSKSVTQKVAVVR